MSLNLAEIHDMANGEDGGKSILPNNPFNLGLIVTTGGLLVTIILQIITVHERIVRMETEIEGLHEGQKTIVEQIYDASAIRFRLERLEKERDNNNGNASRQREPN